MMKKLLYISLVGMGLFACMQNAFARIGERRSDIEKRMDSRMDGAYQYPKEESLREALELPHRMALLLQPFGSDNTFYFKRPDKERTQLVDANNQDDLVGWEMHYAYFENVSVMEFYARYGDPMTVEELEGLMSLMIEGQEDVYWKRENFVSALDRWDVEFADGKPSAVFYTRDGKKIDDDPEKITPLKDLIPTRGVRKIYVEIQPKLKNSGAYSKMIQSLIEDDAQRIAFEQYAELLERRKKYSDDRTKRGNVSKGSSQSAKPDASKRKVIPFTGNYLRDFESHSFHYSDPSNVGFSILKYSAPNVYVGGKTKNNRERKIQWTMDIPLQPETSVGYNFVTSDGKLRALVYENGVLFTNAEYDASIRAYMEELYESQSEDRKAEAKQSLNKF